jgi:DNA-binding Lrp family transcriptional regulator
VNRPEGFAPIPTWMLRDKTVSRRACLVYASLSSRSGLGAIFPSQSTIAEEAGVSERTVRSALSELEQLGVVERISRRGREGRATGMTNAYVLRPNGRFEEPADIAARSKGPAKGPATSDKGTGNELQPLLYKAEIEEAEIEAESRLDSLWNLWPASRRSTRKVVERSLLSALKVADWRTIVDAAERHARVWASWPAAEIQYVPLLSTWLNQERWTAAPPMPRGVRLSTVDAGRAADAILAQQERRAVSA